MEKKWWLRHLGSFSVDPGKLSVNESLAYAAEILNEPGNLLLFFPQGNLESCSYQDYTMSRRYITNSTTNNR
jgi:hypothetical protein